MGELGNWLKKSMQTIGRAKKSALTMNRSMTSPNLLSNAKTSRGLQNVASSPKINPMDIASKYLIGSQNFSPRQEFTKSNLDFE